MSIKRKLLLIGVCIGIIIIVFSVNVVRKMGEDKQEAPLEEVVADNCITRAEAYRLLSYLEYGKTERVAIPMGITYADEQMSGWYDTYVNAVWKMGLIEGNIAITPEETLTYGTCKELIDNIILKDPKLQTVYGKLTFDFSKAEEGLPIDKFLELYEAILALVPEEKKNYTWEKLLVLGREVTEDGKDRMVTDLGKYYYLDAQSYEECLSGKSNKTNTSKTADVTNASETSDTTDVTDDVSSETTDTSEATDTSETTDISDVAETIEASDTSGTPHAADTSEDTLLSDENETSLIEKYMDQGINALVCGQEIIYVASATVDKIVVHNVWIKQGEGLLVDTFINGIDKSFIAEYKLSSNIKKAIGDITIENKKLVQISVKPDMIQGKVLRTGEGFIEIEGYGEVPLEEDYKIYKTYETLSMEPTGSILVGYENTDFIVSDGKISAALITGNIKAENIRVLIQTTDYKDIYHKKVEFTATDEFTVSNGETSTSYNAGDIVLVKPGDKLLKGGRITVKTSSEDAKIEILSMERSYGNPKYRGSIEIAEDTNGLLLINELPLEEYLYAVLPSEMPASYGTEALKVQAVCARSYAYKHLLSNSLSQYGAHVNDSVSYQVYNNIAENEDSILAVKDTYGKVVEYDGDVIIAYYFSTSCGHTAEASNAWANKIDFPYLAGKLLLAEEGEGSEVQSEAMNLYTDLSSEDSFRDFITAKDITTYDSGFNWYRWKVTMDTKNIEKVIDANLSGRYNANPELILTKTSDSKDGEEAVFESLPVDTVGTIVDIKVLKRESSGMISEILITGSKNTIKVKTEYNIRALLAPNYNTITRQDDSEVKNISLLPSAFFIIDKNEKGNKLSSFTITGGGYGHGVGLSQNGVKALADSGKDYEEILTYFYEGTKMGFIYE